MHLIPCLFTEHHWEASGCLFHSCLQVFIHARSHLSLLFSRLNNPSSQPLFVCQTPQSLHQLHSLSLGCFQHIHIALIQVNPELDSTPDVSPGLRRITSLDLMVVAFTNAAQDVIDLCRRQCCWLMFSLVSTRTPRSVSAELFSGWSVPSLH